MISIDLKIDFLVPISAGVITARGKSIKIGKTMCLAEATAMDQDGRWLAHGSSNVMITRGLQTNKGAFSFTGAAAFAPKFINNSE